MNTSNLENTNLENNYTFILPDLQKDFNLATETNVEQATEVSILEVPIEINVEGTAETDFEVTIDTSEINIENKENNNNNWSEKSVSLLKRSVSKQLRKTSNKMVYKPKKYVDIETSQRPKKYVNFNDQLIER